jgi:hypothetical protein
VFHPPVSSRLIAVLPMSHSASCVGFFDFIHLFREFCECLVVFFDEHFFIYGPVI